MKYKYKLIKNDKDKQFIIQEYTEIESEKLSLVCEETYDLENLKKILKMGKNKLKIMLRTPNIYPPSHCMVPIVDALGKMLTSDEHIEKPIEISFDDKVMEHINSDYEDSNDCDPVKKNRDYTNIDELLEDNFTEESKEKKKIIPN